MLLATKKINEEKGKRKKEERKGKKEGETVLQALTNSVSMVEGLSDTYLTRIPRPN
jgi:hypothetical protein